MRSFLAPPAERPMAPAPTPTFSIVIPAYEAAGFIGRAVESALAQTAPAAEVIVSDDGSTDDLERTLAPYGDRIELVRGPHGGPPAARNRGFRTASSEFVANLDADDALQPHWLEALGELAANRPDLDILTTDSYLVRDGVSVRRCYSNGWVFATDDQRGRILEDSFLTSISAVRRSRFLEAGGFDESIRWCDDWDFWLRLILNGSCAGCVDEPLAEYTVREGSISTRRIDVLRSVVRLLKKAETGAVLELHEREALTASIAERQRELARLEAREALVRGEPGARRKALAVALDPGQSALTRAKTSAAAVAPPLGRRLLQARGEVALGAGGLKLKHRLRVAFYCDSDEIGGAEISLANLVGALDSGIEAVVMGTNRRVVEWLASHRPDASTVLLPSIVTKWNGRAMVAHFQALMRLRPDVLQVNLNTASASPWALLCGIAAPGIRVIAVEHLPQPIPRLRRRLLKRLATRRLAAHVAVAERSAVTAAQVAGVDSGSVRTIYNGVPELELEPMPRLVSGTVIGSIGRLHPQKGYDLLVQALPYLPGVTAVLVGEGSERGRLVELAQELEVSERLVLAGWSDEPRRHLTTFDLFVLPSRFEGGPPLVVIEAMLAGLAVVATDVDNVADAVLDRETGLLVPAEDPAALAVAVRALLDDPARRTEMGRRGRERAGERFRVDTMARAYEALYDEVVS